MFLIFKNKLKVIDKISPPNRVKFCRLRWTIFKEEKNLKFILSKQKTKKETLLKIKIINETKNKMKNILQKLNSEMRDVSLARMVLSTRKKIFRFSFLIFVLMFSFLSFSGKASAADTTPPSVDMTYSVNPMGVGARTITASYSEEIVGTPTISIDQPGSTDVTNVSMTSNPGSVWTARTIAQANNWYGITYGNGTFVAVSSNGTNRVMTSPDGITWTPRTATEANSWNSVTYGNSLFVAVAYDGVNRVMTSPDGITWTPRTAEANTWQSLIYGNGLFLAVASSGTNRVMTSPDGITWTPRTAAEANSWNSVTYGNNLFVAVANSGTNRVMTSPDGITWTPRTAASVSEWRSITYGNGLFVVVAWAAGYVMTSIDGINWVQRNASEYNGWNSVTYGNGLFVAVGDSGGGNSTNRMMTSVDGINWTSKFIGIYNWSRVNYVNGLFFAFNSSGITSTSLVTSSGFSYSYTYNVNQSNGSTYIDGIANVSLSSVNDSAGNPSNLPTHNTFTIETVAPTVAISYTANPIGTGVNTIKATYSEAVTTTPTISINQPGSADISNATMVPPGSFWTARTAAEANNWYSVTYGNGLFVAVAYNGTNRVMTSPDGITWTPRTAAQANSWYSVTYGNGLFVAVSGDGVNRVMTSPDGITWTPRTAEANYWNSVTYGNNLFVAVAGSGTNRVMTSPDGITWTPRTAAEANGWVSVTYGNGLFVAVTSSGTNRVMTSPDGITWTPRIAAQANSWFSVTYGNNMFVAISRDGTNRVMTSPDGITWTPRTAAQANSWYSVIYGNGLFVAVSDTTVNQVMTSPDGITWTIRTDAQANSWMSVTYGNGLFVAVSTNGTNRVMTSPNFYAYDYLVSKANGSTYIDGTATVSLSSVTDLVGNPSALPTNNTFVIDTTGPDVALSYSANPAKAGVNTITATYTEAIVGTPQISINQPGTTDIVNANMTGSGTTWTYNYIVNTANGTTYVDGGVVVSLSTTTNAAGVFSGSPTNTNFIIDTASPTVTYTYSANPTKVGTEIITATYSEPIVGTPNISINQPGSTDISNTTLANVGGDTWTTRTAAQANNWKSVTYGNGLFVAVSGSTAIMTSLDGITWVSRLAPESNPWMSVTYGNGIFVAVAQSGINRVMTSPDGITWTARTAAQANSWLNVTYGNGLFVAVSIDGTNRVMTSPNGITWTPRTAATGDWYSATYGNGLFVAVGSNGTNVMTSPNGITWTPRTAAPGAWYEKITYGNGLFVALSSYNDKSMTSTDGITWTQGTTMGTSGWKSITYGNGLFVAVTSSGTNRVMTSPNGITWTAKTASVANSWQSVTYGNGLFVAVESSYTGTLMTSPAFMYSYSYPINQANGTTYIDGTATVSVPATTDLAGNALVASTTNTFVIDTTGPNVALSYSRNPTSIGTNTVTATYSEPISSTPTISINQPGSTDISNVAMTAPVSVWTPRNATEANSWFSVTYGNGLFVAVAQSGTNRVMTSPDGITWTPRTAAQANQWYSVVYGNGLFVAVAQSGTNRVMTSPDGITWTPRVAAEANAWQSIAYGNGLFVAVAVNGTNRVMTSSDGITWTPRNAAQANTWLSITYGNGIFVAVEGSGGTVMSSFDGITWTMRSPSSFDSWYSVIYGNGLFVAVANVSSKVMVSSNGINWTGVTNSMTGNWRSLVYGNGLFVAVAIGGTNRVMTSPANYTYDYTVTKANGGTYIDGTANVTLSSVTDTAGNTSNAPTGATFEIDTATPRVALTYSKNPAGVGANIITATYSRPITSIPNISINQPGSTDISNVAMTGSGSVYTYSYTVNAGNGSTYIDGEATVSLSATMDSDGNTTDAPTNTTFNIETIPPTASLTYSINHAVKTGDSQIITATFNEPMADLPLPQIAISGSNTLALTNMTKVDTTHYTYTHTVGAGNGVATVTLGTGTDLAVNTITSIPTLGATFSVDNTAPAGTIGAICSNAGNGCTTLGQNANPQESYQVNSIGGTSSDEVNGSGVSVVDISVKDVIQNKWYGTGATFTEVAETYHTAVGTSIWTYDFSTVPLIVDQTYLINVKTTDVAGNTQVTPLTFKFTNSPPTVSNLVAEESVSGIVSVTYDVTDIESTQTTNKMFFGIGLTLVGNISASATTLTLSNGTPLPTTGTIMIDDEVITYTSKNGNSLEGLTRGVNTTGFAHNTGTEVFMYASTATGTGIGASAKGTGKAITWNTKSDLSDFETLTGLVKVVANDGSAGSMIGSMNSTPLVIDTKKPTAIVTFDAGIAGEANSGTITISMPVDISTVEYKIVDDAISETNPTDTGWVSITTNTTIPWTFDSDIEVKTIKYQYRDSYGNTSDEVSTSTQTPIPSSSFIVQDTTNLSIPSYDMYIGWQAAGATGFSAYKLEYATSDDNITYGDYGTISDASFYVVGSNYYVFRNLDSTKFYRFRLGVVGTNENTSVRSNSYITTKPDGVQNYGEGGGGSVATASRVESIVPTQNLDKSVTISYKLTDASILKKVNPSYEAYVFYNIGITLPENSFVNDTLILTDSSRLKSSGYILINNEVIAYSGNTGNTLTGLTRGTWPVLYSSGRVTRENTDFLAGTPVWILGYDTGPIHIPDTTIQTGQPSIITWGAGTEQGLIGGKYSDVGIKILIHDNQDALSGPLSSQNDFSETGILPLLDLSISNTAYNAIKSTSAVISWTTTDYGDSVVEYGTVMHGQAGEYGLTKSSTDKVLNHRIYLNNLTPSTLYYFKTKSTNLNEETTVSISEFTTTAGPVLSSVSSGNITDVASTISWTTDIPATSSVTYSANADMSSPVTLNNDELVTSHTVNITGLLKLKTYYFKVESKDAVDGNTGEETNNEAYYTFTTLADMTPPEITDISAPLISSSSVAIVWKTNEPTDGQISYGTETGVYDKNTILSTSFVANHIATIDELKPSTDYFYIVKSRDENGNLATSVEQIVKTTAQTVVISRSGVLQEVYDAIVKENEENKAKLKAQNTELPVISNLTVSDVTAFGATVSFSTDKETIAFVDYGKESNIYLKNEGSSTWSKNHSIKLSGLNFGTDYFLKVKAVDKFSNVATSEEQAFKTKFFTEDLSGLTKIENIEQFQAEIEATIESILPSLVPPFIERPIISDITESSAIVTFKTNIKAYPIVNYTTDVGYDITKDKIYDGEMSDTTGKNLSHVLQLIGLKPNTKYHVMARAFSFPQVIGKSEDITFSTKASKIKASVVDRKNDSFTVVWTTDDPTSSIVEYKNTKNGRTDRMTDIAKNTSHSVKVENLIPGTNYEVTVSGINEIGNIVEGGEPIMVYTSTDVIAPVISNFKVDSALVVGRTDRTQTIVSWTTDEPATSVVTYEEGSGSPDKALANKKEDTELTMNHVVILTTLKPGTVYRFQVESKDNANNVAKLPIRTIITPKPNESIVDVIFKNFDETFNFLKNVK
jgi:hypothetical protein